MKRSIYAIAAIALSVIFCGCMEEPEAPPLSLERTELIQRLFVSLKKNDKAAAISQTEKLQKLMPGNSFCSHVLETMTANTYIIHAQKAIDEGHETLALNILEQGLRKHPMNHILINQYKNFKLICDIENALAKGDFRQIPVALYSVPEYGVRLIKKMQAKNIPVERKE